MSHLALNHSFPEAGPHGRLKLRWAMYGSFENEDFLYEAPEYRHMLVLGNRPTDRVPTATVSVYVAYVWISPHHIRSNRYTCCYKVDVAFA